VVALAPLLISRELDAVKLVTLISLILLLRKIFSVICSYLSGILSLYVRVDRVFKSSISLALTGLLLVMFGWPIMGAIIAFFGNAIIITLLPVIPISQDTSDGLQAISGVSTWWDMGATLGALLGLVLVNAIGTEKLFLSLFVLCTLSFVYFIKDHGKSNRTII